MSRSNILRGYMCTHLITVILVLTSRGRRERSDSYGQYIRKDPDVSVEEKYSDNVTKRKFHKRTVAEWVDIR